MNSTTARLLFVDDEAELHDLVDAILEDLPITLSHALTGEQGMKMINESDEFAIILSNHNLGAGVSGRDFLKWVKSNSPKSSRILITGGIDKDSMQKMVTGGDIDDFAQKPILVENFIDQVKNGISAYNATL